MKILDCASVCRTKNAGIYLLTIDVIFDNREHYRRARKRLTPALIAELYAVPIETVHIVNWESLLAIKATVPRWGAAGSPGDRDVYGCQQHAPVLEVEL